MAGHAPAGYLAAQETNAEDSQKDEVEVVFLDDELSHCGSFQDNVGRKGVRLVRERDDCEPVLPVMVWRVD